MELLKELVIALKHQDFVTLADPSVAFALYSILFLILFLENGLLPAAFLPGDSLLILVGVLVAKGSMTLPAVFVILTIAASLGSWLSFIQGRLLGNTQIVRSWLEHLPQQYHDRAHNLFHKHGLSALLLGRFIAFVRTLLPTVAGLSKLEQRRFQLFNWLSAFLWVMSLTVVGYFFGKTQLFNRHQEELMLILTLLPLFLLVGGLISSIFVIWRKRRNNQ